VKAAHAAEVPARGVDPPLSSDEGTVDNVFEMGVEVAISIHLYTCIKQYVCNAHAPVHSAARRTSARAPYPYICPALQRQSYPLGWV
jgi:hypothetical protein